MPAERRTFSDGDGYAIAWLRRQVLDNARGEAYFLRRSVGPLSPAFLTALTMPAERRSLMLQMRLLLRVKGLPYNARRGVLSPTLPVWRSGCLPMPAERPAISDIPLRGHCQFSFAVSGQAGLRESEIVRLSAGMVRGMSEIAGLSAGIGRHPDRRTGRVGESTPLRGHCQASN